MLLHVLIDSCIYRADRKRNKPAFRALTRLARAGVLQSLGFRSAEGAWRTIDGYEAMHVIRKGQIRWLAKGDVVDQRQFIHALFGIAA